MALCSTRKGKHRQFHMTCEKGDKMNGYKLKRI